MNRSEISSNSPKGTAADWAAADWAEKTIGRHVLLDLYGVPVERLVDGARLLAELQRQLTAAGFHVIGQHLHQFPGSGSGATGVVLLSESHAAFHTYPEHGYAALDVFSCGPADVETLTSALLSFLSPQRVNRRDFARGEFSPSGEGSREM